ncbi:MAG TPA: hypothetical protein VEV83_21300 [Parafilimonas sp.]|nr:hypothetical protein [Parafilimonas sp.]
MNCLLVKTWLLITLIIFSLARFGQNNLAPVFEIKNDTAVYQALDNRYYEMLEDTTDKLTFEQVLREPVSSNFHYNKSSLND